MSAHTPGPWSRAWIAGAIRHINRNVETDCFYDHEIAGEDPDSINHPSRNEADYDLIAAAPELLAALEKVTNALGEHLSRNWPNADHPNDRIIKKARAAIAKARGES